MNPEDADGSNFNTEKKYQKTAKVGEGTYAVVYRGKCRLLFSLIFFSVFNCYSLNEIDRSI